MDELKFRSFAPKVLASMLLLSMMTTQLFLLSAFGQSNEPVTQNKSVNGQYLTDLTALASANSLSVSQNFDVEVGKLVRALASNAQTPSR